MDETRPLLISTDTATGQIMQKQRIGGDGHYVLLGLVHFTVAKRRHQTLGSETKEGLSPQITIQDSEKPSIPESETEWDG